MVSTYDRDFLTDAMRTSSTILALKQQAPLDPYASLVLPIQRPNTNRLSIDPDTQGQKFIQNVPSGQEVLIG